MAVDEVEFRELFASQYARLCWLGLLLTGDRAEAEELALGTVKSLAHRGLARLRDRLGSPDLDPTTTRREAR
jgi:DNA-directed RNA polymerase specialized sigma24 family protein